MSKAITIGGASTPPSATSPHSRQRRNTRNPVSTFPGEGQTAMNKTTPEQNKAALVLEAFDTLFNKRDYAATEASGRIITSSTAPISLQAATDFRRDPDASG